MLVMWLCRYWWGMLLCATYRRWCGPGVLRPWVRRYPWHQQQTGSQQTISKARTTICISARRGMQETQSGKLTHFLADTTYVDNVDVDNVSLFADGFSSVADPRGGGGRWPPRRARHYNKALILVNYSLFNLLTALIVLVAFSNVHSFLEHLIVLMCYWQRFV